MRWIPIQHKTIAGIANIQKLFELANFIQPKHLKTYDNIKGYGKSPLPLRGVAFHDTPYFILFFILIAIIYIANTNAVEVTRNTIAFSVSLIFIVLIIF